MDLGIRYLAAEAETEDLDMDIERIDPWGVSIEDILISTEEADLSVGTLLLLFSPSGLTAGEIDSFTLRDISLEMGRELISYLMIRVRKLMRWIFFGWKIREYLSDPKLKHFPCLMPRLLGHGLSFLPLEFTIKGDYSEGSASTTVDGELSGFLSCLNTFRRKKKILMERWK